MTTPTRLLVRWQYGYTSVGTGDVVGYLTLGSLGKSAAERVARKELARLAREVEQISLGADPDPVDPANAYGTGWDVGDYVLAPDRGNDLYVTLTDENDDVLTDENDVPLIVSAGGPQRVLQVSITEDDDGALEVMPDLSSLVDQIGIRHQRWLDRMADGTLKGSSAVAQPITTPEFVPARRPGQTSETFSWNPVSTIRTGAWVPEVRGRLAQMHLTRRGGDNTGHVRVAFIVNGVTLDEGIIHPGFDEGVFGGTGVDFGPGDKLELEPTEIDGCENLTVRVVQTHYH